MGRRGPGRPIPAAAEGSRAGEPDLESMADKGLWCSCSEKKREIREKRVTRGGGDEILSAGGHGGLGRRGREPAQLEVAGASSGT